MLKKIFGLKEAIASLKKTAKPRGVDKEQDSNLLVRANGEISNELQKRIKGAGLPEFAEDFLTTHWSKLLLKIYIRDGAEGNAWDQALVTVDEMVKCLGSNTSPAEKRSMQGLFKELGGRLRNGLRAVSMPKEVQENFFVKYTNYYGDIFENVVLNRSNLPGAGQQNDKAEQQHEKVEPAAPFSSELLVDNKPGKKNF